MGGDKPGSVHCTAMRFERKRTTNDQSSGERGRAGGLAAGFFLSFYGVPKRVHFVQITVLCALAAVGKFGLYTLETAREFGVGAA
ncbi:hypothetical protein BZA02_102203 [Ruegeria sp. P4]|nr:hypothetical protein BZA02_102203 [Ruegeria sp. P4]